MQTLFDSNYATVFYITEYSEVRIVWKDVTLTFEQYQTPFLKALEFQETTQCDNFLSDTRKQRIISPAFRKWFQDYAIPTAKSQGLIRGAVVMSGNIFKKYYLNNIFNTTKKFGIELKFFGELSDAENWFKIEKEKL
jgi:hypothetical protein